MIPALNIILITIAVMIMIEGILLFFFENELKKLLKQLIKKKGEIKRLGFIEIIISAIILMIVLAIP